MLAHTCMHTLTHAHIIIQIVYSHIILWVMHQLGYMRCMVEWIPTHTHTLTHTYITHAHILVLGEGGDPQPAIPSCSTPPVVNTKQSRSLPITIVGSVIASAAVCLLMFIAGASITVLLYKRKRNLAPKNSLDATSHAVYSHLYRGMGSQIHTL